MKNLRLSFAFIAGAIISTCAKLNTQITGDHTFMISDFVEIGINEAGYEGTPLGSTIPTHYRGYSEKLII